MEKYMIVFCFLLFSLLISCISAGRTREKIYYNIKGFSPCFRRLNGTHQFGCSSFRNGNVGVLHIIKNQTDFDWLLSDETKSQPYVVVLKPEQFNYNSLLKLKLSSKINGVILAMNHSENVPASFSSDGQCPNEYSGLGPSQCDRNQPWNPYGTGIFFGDWPFPIFYLDKLESLSKINECFETHNVHVQGDQQLCAVELLAYMFAVGDSKTCIRRSNLIMNLNPVKVCDPIGDQNFWLSPYLIKKNNSKKAVILTSRLDSFSLFDTVVTGADSPITGLVTLLATAFGLKQLIKDETKLKDNIMYVLLHGESFDYVGSSRFIWDMEKGLLPINLEDIRLLVELNQISNISNSHLHVHLGKNRSGKPFANNLKTNFKQKGFKIDIEDSTRLPPASLQSFQKANDNISGIVITDHGSQFINKYYHSIFDNSSNINYNNETKSIQEFIAKISITLAQTIYAEISEDKSDSEMLELNDEILSLVDDLLYCYLVSMNCTLFRESVSPGQTLPDEPMTTYVGVTINNSLMVTLTGQTLAYITGNMKQDWNQSQCNEAAKKHPDYVYIWVNGKNMTGVCVETLMNITAASSPAFEIPDYDWSSGKYPTWTESTWADFRMRIFVKPPRSHEIFTLTIGTIVMVVSFLIVYFLNSRSEMLFIAETPSVAC